jgi:septal ring factor EnvC (AmiA/AmiB activator)
MLIALATFLILHFGAGTSPMLLHLDQLEKAVKHFVTDDAHKARALKIVDHMKKTEKALVDKQKKAIQSLDEKLGQRTMSASDIDRDLAPMSAESKAARAKLLELRFELKTVLSAGEWAQVFPAPKSDASPVQKPLIRD